MSIQLTDTQIFMLSVAAQCDDRCLVVPRNLKGVATRKVAAKLIDAGVVKEIRARSDAPVWRQEARTGHSFALNLTAAGVKVIAADSRSSSMKTQGDKDERSQLAEANSEAIELRTAENVATDAGRSCGPRAGTKLARVVGLLQRDCGVTLQELIEATGWLPHTTRVDRIAQARPCGNDRSVR